MRPLSGPWVWPIGMILGFILATAPTSFLHAEETRTSFDAQFDRWLSQLADDDIVTRRAAFEKLSTLPAWRLTLPRSTRLLKAAERQFPPLNQNDIETSAQLISIVTSRPRIEHVATINESFAKYDPAARRAAMALLGCLDDRRAAEAVMQLVRDYSKTGGIPALAAGEWVTKPQYAEVFFPELLNYASDATLEEEILGFLLGYCQGADISEDVLTRCTSAITERYRFHKRQIFPLQRATDTSWVWQEDYQSHRKVTCDLLDILGYCAAKEARAELRRGLSYRDPKLRLHAAISLTRAGYAIEPKVFTELAANPEVRLDLFERLEAFDLSELFPEKYHTQAALAEADLVRWLASSQLRRPPAEIELAKIISIDPQTEIGILDYYVFRYRVSPPHEKASDGWLAGVAGPFVRVEQPTSRAQGDTGSKFEPFESKSPEEHVGDLPEIAAQWHLRTSDER
jgi:hypothetical protein